MTTTATTTTGDGDCDLDASKDELEFGKVKKGKSAYKTVTIENESGDDCELDIEEDSRHFSISSSSECEDGDDLDGNDDCKLRVKFKPLSKGTKKADLEVNDLEIELEGKGV